MAAYLKSSVSYEEWKRMRRNTTIAMLLANLVGGIDISIIVATIIPYLKQTIKVKNVEAYYAFITTSFCVSSALFGVVAGKIVDRTRRIKLFTSITLILQITGNLIYTIPFSPVFPLIGRLLAGAGESFTSVCIGEVIRVYDTEGGNRVICWLATMSSFGYVVGPLLSVPLSTCHFSIGDLRVDGYNIPGVVIAILCTLTLIICQFLIHDLSRQFDMKSYLNHNSLKVEPVAIEEKTWLNYDSSEMTHYHFDEEKHDYFYSAVEEEQSLINNHTTSSKSSTRTLFKTFDQCFLLALSFFMMFVIANGESLLPLINYQLMSWNLHILVTTFVGYGILLLIVSLALSKLCTNEKQIYYVGFVSLPCVVMCYLTLLIISVTQREDVKDAVLLCILVVALVFTWFLESVALRTLYGQMVSSDSQSFAEAMRNGISRFGMIISNLVTPFMMPYLVTFSSLFMCFGLVMFAVYVSRRKLLTNIRVVEESK